MNRGEGHLLPIKMTRRWRVGDLGFINCAKLKLPVLQMDQDRQTAKITKPMCMGHMRAIQAGPKVNGMNGHASLSIKITNA